MSVFRRYRYSTEATRVQDDHYSYRFRLRGKQFTGTTKYVNAKDAVRVEKSHRLAIENERVELVTLHLQRRRVSGNTPLQLYITALTAPGSPVCAKRATLRGYTNSLINALRRSGIAAREDTATEILGLPIRILDETFVERFYADAGARVKTATQQDGGSIMRSTNSIAAHILGLFNVQTLLHFKSLGLELPDIIKLREAIRSRRFARVPRQELGFVSDEIAAHTFRSWESLPRDQFLAFGLALSFGLRRGEIGQTRWGWHTIINGQPYLSAGADTVTVKSGTGNLGVRAVDPFYTTMMTRIDREGWRGDKEDFVLSGSVTNRTSGVFRDLSRFMRGQGWSTRKTIHAVRQWVASQIAMLERSDYAAKIWLRHGDCETFASHYSKGVTALLISNPNLITVRWATLPVLAPIQEV